MHVPHKENIYWTQEVCSGKSFDKMLFHLKSILSKLLSVLPVVVVPFPFLLPLPFERGILKPGAGNSGGKSHFHPTKSSLVSAASQAGFSQPEQELAIKGTTITLLSPQKSCKIFSADASLRHHDGLCGQCTDGVHIKIDSRLLMVLYYLLRYIGRIIKEACCEWSNTWPKWSQIRCCKIVTLSCLPKLLKT